MADDSYAWKCPRRWQRVAATAERVTCDLCGRSLSVSGRPRTKRGAVKLPIHKPAKPPSEDAVEIATPAVFEFAFDKPTPLHDLEHLWQPDGPIFAGLRERGWIDAEGTVQRHFRMAINSKAERMWRFTYTLVPTTSTGEGRP